MKNAMQELVISWVQCAVVELSSLVEVHVYRYIASEISMYTYSSKLCSFCFLMEQIKVDSVEMECLSFFRIRGPRATTLARFYSQKMIFVLNCIQCRYVYIRRL